MRLPHLLAVREGPEAFAPLVAAAAAENLRCGWLDLLTSAPDPPPALAGAAGLDVLRAVAVGPGSAVTLKLLRGAPVLRDLLREHFLGCALVLVRGGQPLPALTPAGDRWRLDLPGDQTQTLDLPALVSRLRRPRPFA